MINLLVNSTATVEIDKTSFGGRPVKNKDQPFQWPICSLCELPMQFLGKVLGNDELHQIFMCQNDPGMCDDWDANGGANAVIITKPIELEFVPVPAEGVTLRETEYSAAVVEFEASTYEEARNEWVKNNSVSRREVLGQILGQPSWIQGEDIPVCNHCHKPMQFMVQLEQGPDWKTEMNFGGGGAAYLFSCACRNSAKFLWQS
ncbi:MAG: hypothetical protein AAF485_02835 [Chloroflexota bacterium]